MVEMTEQKPRQLCIMFFTCPPYINYPVFVMRFYVGYCTVAINFAQATIWVIEEQT